MSGRRATVIALSVVAASSVFVTACSNVAAPLPQVLLVVDTDAPLVSQVAGDPTLSLDATIDTIRVDATYAHHGVDRNEFVAPEVTDWPLSFGVPVLDGELPSLQIRGFRGAFAVSGEAQGKASLDPRAELTIDRLVDLPSAIDGVVKVHVVLSMDCFGVRPSFAGAHATCIDAARTAVPPSVGVEIVNDVPASRVGSWPHAREVPCSGAEIAGTQCVPGGFSILGDLSTVGVAATGQFDGWPMRPVLVSPFRMDTTEVTVGRLRALVNAGKFDAELPVAQADVDGKRSCTWLGASDATNDALPINCMTWDASVRLCELSGGTLPSEAEWEHAARGRGQRRKYTWGDDEPTCCATSIERTEVGGPMRLCGVGIEPAGTHPIKAGACGGIGDVSRDGVMDLGGSMTEPTRDIAVPFDDPCWSAGGVLSDPVCMSAASKVRSARGSYWNAGLLTVLTPLRVTSAEHSPAQGVRCVYPGSK
jgi:hypothetical protein